MRSAPRPLPRLLAPLGLLLALLLPALAPAPQARAAAFAEGNVVVYRVGDGSAPLADSGNPVFLDEFTPAGALVQSLPMPTTAGEGSWPLFASTRADEGLITRSADGRSLIVTGYGRRDTAFLPSSSAMSYRRVIATVEANGEVTTSTALTDLANGYVPRSAASSDGFNFWAVGGAGGVRFALGSASTSTELVAAPSSLNQVAIFEGQLYASTAAGAGVRIGKVGDGLPVSGPQTLTPLPGLPTTGNPNAFFLANLSPAVPGVDTLYVAYDDQGLRKFALVNGSWAARGTVGGDADDYRGLTAAVQGQSVTLYATRRAGELVRLVDASGYGGNLAGTPALIATADDNTAFRGVALAPRAADELQPDLTVSVSGPSTATVGAAYSYGLSVRNDGIVAATGVSVTFTLPPGVTYLAATGGAGFTPSASGGVVTFNGGSLGVGVQADLLVSVSAGAVGPVTVAPGAAVADPANTIPELREDNNSSPETVVTSIVPVGGPSDDTVPPETTITARPPAVSTSGAARFTFTGRDNLTPEGALGFQCSLDGAPFGPCTSPRTYTGLGLGAHTFRVRAIDAAGNADPSPASHSWSVRMRLFAPIVRR